MFIQNQWKRDKLHRVHSFVFVAWNIDLTKIIIDFNSLFTGKICAVDSEKWLIF